MKVMLTALLVASLLGGCSSSQRGLSTVQLGQSRAEVLSKVKSDKSIVFDRPKPVTMTDGKLVQEEPTIVIYPVELYGAEGVAFLHFSHDSLDGYLWQGGNLRRSASVAEEFRKQLPEASNEEARALFTRMVEAMRDQYGPTECGQTRSDGECETYFWKPKSGTPIDKHFISWFAPNNGVEVYMLAPGVMI